MGSSPKDGCSIQDASDSDDTILDPRIYKELEKLNKASEDINCLEVELDNARVMFRLIMSESITQLDTLARRLGSCVEKARPYYDARKKALEAQVCTQNAAVKFERACGQLSAAKEMVNLAEQGYFKMGQRFDPAWQEMLNHSTMKVNNAEKERLECEVAHRMTMFIFAEAEQNVRRLQKESKRSISKSKPYFEMKAKYNQMLEEQKKKIQELESSVACAKEFYAGTLRMLEKISDEIHRNRELQRKKQRRTVARPKRPGQIYHPLMDASEVVLEEVSSPSPEGEDKMVNDLDALHIKGKMSALGPSHSPSPPPVEDDGSSCRSTPRRSEMSGSSPKLLYRAMTGVSLRVSGARSGDSPSDQRASVNEDESEDTWSRVMSKTENKLLEGVASFSSSPMHEDERLSPTMTSGASTQFSITSLDTKSSRSVLLDQDHLLVSSTKWEASVMPLKRLNLGPPYESITSLATLTVTSEERLVSSVSCECLTPSEMLCLSDRRTLVHAPMNPLKVESLSTERVSQEVHVSECIVEHLEVKNRQPMTEASKEKKGSRSEGWWRRRKGEVRSRRITQRTDNRDASLSESQSSSSPEQERSSAKSQKTSRMFPEEEDVQLGEKRKPEEPPDLNSIVALKIDGREDSLFSTMLVSSTQGSDPSSDVWSSSASTQHLSPFIQDHEQGFQMTVRDSEVVRKSQMGIACQGISWTLRMSPTFGELSQGDASSETESVASSLNSATLLDDEQVESLMLETSQYHSFLSRMDSQETELYKHLTLPSKLRYLENMVSFEPVWQDNCNEKEREVKEEEEKNKEEDKERKGGEVENVKKLKDGGQRDAKEHHSKGELNKDFAILKDVLDIPDYFLELGDSQPPSPELEEDCPDLVASTSDAQTAVKLNRILCPPSSKRVTFSPKVCVKWNPPMNTERQARKNKN